MFASPTPFEIESPSSAEVVLERLRRVAADWRQSAVNPRGRKAGILGWGLRESSAGIEFAAAPYQSVCFRGKILDTPAGSVIRGMLEPWDRTTGAYWIIQGVVGWLLLAFVVAFALFAPIPGVLWSWLRLPVAGAVAIAARVLGRRFRRYTIDSWQGALLALTGTLQAVAKGDAGTESTTITTHVVRQQERLIDKVAIGVAGGLALAALATPWLFVARARSPSWRDALAIPAGAVVFVAGTIALVLLERRARVERHRTWLPTMIAFLIVFAAAMTVAVVYPDHPWQQAVYFGVPLGALQSWMTWERMRMSA